MDEDSDISNADFWKNAGDDLVKQEKYDMAIESYKEAVSIDPNYIKAWNNLGYAYSKLGRLDEAKRCREKINSIQVTQSDIPPKIQSNTIGNQSQDLQSKPPYSEYPSSPKKSNVLKTALFIIGGLVLILIIAAVIAAFIFGMAGSSIPSDTQSSYINDPIISQSGYTNDPIIGTWKEYLSTQDVMFTYTFLSNGDYLEVSSDFPGITLDGKWRKTNENQYTVSYSFTDEDEIYIYNPTTDTLTEPEYPSLTIYRDYKMPGQTSYSPSVYSSTPKYKVGDVVGEAYGESMGDLILAYTPQSDKYTVQVVHLRNGQWVYLSWGPRSWDREFEESYDPIILDHINPNSVQPW